MEGILYACCMQYKWLKIIVSLLHRSLKEKVQTYHTLMISSFEALHKYVTDLIIVKPEHSPMWHSIDTANPTFKDRVACMKKVVSLTATVK